MIRIVMLAIALLVSSVSMAQMPKNDNKEFEYKAQNSVKRAGTGDLMKRIEKWGNDYFKDVTSFTISIDDSTKRYVEMDVVESMVESHFGVNRTHKNRSLSYHIKFDADRKDYNYSINEFYYKALEVDHKNRETQLDAKLSDIKGAASGSLEEEVHMKMEQVIESFSKALEIELED
jgi:hypothetical protein